MQNAIHKAARLVDAIENVDVDLAVCGPSTIGNLFAANAIPATCGFAASYRNLHAPNEAVEHGTLPNAYRVYRRAVERLLIPPT
jgi:acetylornithine deacetylase/succinyl-diaminopimelate desuccinylase-like protein